MKMNVFCSSPKNQYGNHSLYEIGKRTPMIQDMNLKSREPSDKPASIRYKVLVGCLKCRARGET